MVHVIVFAMPALVNGWQAMPSRRWLLATATAGDWRQYTAIVPLGPAVEGGNKLRGLSLEAMAARLVHDATEGATGRGGYLVTGDLDPRLFDDRCRFVDPTNDVASLSRYRRALLVLFDADVGQEVSLLGKPTIDAERRSVTASLRVGPGVIKLPWRPKIGAFDTAITWFLDDDGIVKEQSQLWSISASAALRQTFGLPP